MVVRGIVVWGIAGIEWSENNRYPPFELVRGEPRPERNWLKPFELKVLALVYKPPIPTLLTTRGLGRWPMQRGYSVEMIDDCITLDEVNVEARHGGVGRRMRQQRQITSIIKDRPRTTT